MDDQNPIPALPVRELPPPPCKSPRPLDAGARWAIRIEPRVRRWWYLVAMTCLLFVGFCADRLWARHTEGQLIRTGLAVNAKITSAANKQNHQPFGSGEPCNLEVFFPTGSEQYLEVYLHDGGTTGSTILIHVDPSDHSRWTDRSQATPLLESLVVGLIILPLIPLLSFLGYRQMKSLERLWTGGQAALAVVFDRRPSPVAPTCYAIRAGRQDQRSRDLFTVYVPRIGNGLEKGDVIWVIAGAKNERPLAVMWMPPTEST